MLSCLVYIKMYGYTTVNALYILNVKCKHKNVGWKGALNFFVFGTPYVIICI